MEKQELPSLPLIRPYPKEGIALHAEETVQALLDHPRDTPDIIKRSDQTIDNHFNSSTTGEYKKAGWRNHIAIGALGHLVVRNAMLDILETHHYFGTLSPPSLSIDTFLLAGDHSDALEVASSSGYWLMAHTQRTFEQISCHRNQYNPLFEHYANNELSYISWLGDWRMRPGKNRWPTDDRKIDCKQHLLNSLQNNTRFATNLLCTKAIHHLIHKNRRAESDELYRAAMESIEQISWQTTGNRHYGWVPDWKERKANNERLSGMTPTDGARALLTIQPSMLTFPNEFASSKDGSDIMRSPDFCLHRALQEGPIPKAGLCPGNIFINQSNKDTREIARTFFTALGMHPDNGNCYSIAGVALAMGSVTLKNVILPAYEARKRAEIEGRLWR